MKEKRHVRPQRRADRSKLWIFQACGPELVAKPQGRGGVAAAPAETAALGDVFGEFDTDIGLDAALASQKRRRSIREVGWPCKMGDVTREGEPHPRRDGDLVAQIHTDRDGLDVVEAIGPAGQHFESQVDLGRGTRSQIPCARRCPRCTVVHLYPAPGAALCGESKLHRDPEECRWSAGMPLRPTGVLIGKHPRFLFLPLNPGS